MKLHDMLVIFKIAVREQLLCLTSSSSHQRRCPRISYGKCRAVQREPDEKLNSNTIIFNQRDHDPARRRALISCVTLSKTISCTCSTSKRDPFRLANDLPLTAQTPQFSFNFLIFPSTRNCFPLASVSFPPLSVNNNCPPA